MTQERQESLAQNWDEVLRSEVDKAGMDATGQGDKVLRIDSEMTRIAPTADFSQAQNAAGRNTIYAESSGEASVEFRLYDQGSGELLAVIRDKRSLGTQTWSRSSTVTASADARHTLRNWAKQLVARISGN
jgi:hypothetical protein